jgi:hypothetical protein
LAVPTPTSFAYSQVDHKQQTEDKDKGSRKHDDQDGDRQTRHY